MGIGPNPQSPIPNLFNFKCLFIMKFSLYKNFIIKFYLLVIYPNINIIPIKNK